MKSFNFKSLQVIIITLSSMVCPNYVFCQTYNFTYDVFFQNNSIPLDKKEQHKTNRQEAPLPVTITMNYIVTANQQYMHLIGIVQNTISPVDNLNGSHSEIIIDLKNKLVYFPEDKKVKRLIMYQLTDEKAAKNDCYDNAIKGFDERYSIKTCKELPNLITPGLKFKKSNFGVREVRTPTFALALKEFHTSDEKLDYEDLFKPFLHQEITETYNFFY